MSQKIVSQKTERLCEGCGLVYTWDDALLEFDVVKARQEWIIIGRELFSQGQWIKVLVHACSPKCMAAAEAKISVAAMQIPSVEEPADNIDLGALRVSDVQPN